MISVSFPIRLRICPEGVILKNNIGFLMIFCRSFSKEMIVMEVVKIAQNPDRTTPIMRKPMMMIQYIIIYMEFDKSNTLEVHAPTQ
jgi:hypothetical protein